MGIEMNYHHHNDTVLAFLLYTSQRLRNNNYTNYNYHSHLAQYRTLLMRLSAANFKLWALFVYLQYFKPINSKPKLYVTHTCSDVFVLTVRWIGIRIEVDYLDPVCLGGIFTSYNSTTTFPLPTVINEWMVL